MRYRARAPLRIDLAGGWTDVPEYAREMGGAVVNAAITRYVTGTISRPDRQSLAHALRGDRSEVSYSLDLPSGAGLGASAAQTVLWVTLVKTTIANVSSRAEIAEIACQVERLLGIVGGAQDEYASALGGIQYLTFGETVQSERLLLAPPLESELRSRLVLVYSGDTRLSASIHEDVWGAYRSGAPGVRDALASLRSCADDMRQALLTGNLQEVGRVMSENWEQQKRLHPSVSNPNLDNLVDLALTNGAIGGKACGAGGGGCLVFLAEIGREAQLREVFRQRKLQVIDFSFDTYGVHLNKA